MLRIAYKLPLPPEIPAARLSRADLEPVWRSAANGVAASIRRHFLTLGGRRFWGEASEKVRVRPRSHSRFEIAICQRGVHLQYKGGTVRPTGKPSEVTGKPTKSLLVPPKSGPMAENNLSLYEFLQRRQGSVRVIVRKATGRAFLVLDQAVRIKIPAALRGKNKRKTKDFTRLTLLGSLLKQVTIPAHPEVLPTRKQMNEAAAEAAATTFNKLFPSK